MKCLNILLKEKRIFVGKINDSLLCNSLTDFMVATERPDGSKFRLVGLDVGLQKCGVAISDESLDVSIPLSIVDTSSLDSHLKFMKNNLIDYALIIGLPLTLSGALGSSCLKICHIINSLSDVINDFSIPVWFHDERYTTSISYQDYSVKRRSNKFVDHYCAMKILQEHLDLRKLKTS